MRDDDASSFVFLLLGGLTGAALATLLMPRSGADTRRALRRRVHDRAERLSSWRSGRASDDRRPAAPSAASERVPEPGLPSTTSTYESQA